MSCPNKPICVRFGTEAATIDAQHGRLGPPRHVSPPGNVTNKGNNDLPNATGYNNRTLPRAIVLARYLPTGTGGATGAIPVQALIYSPSSRLKLGLVAAFEPDSTTTPDPAFVVAPSWNIRVMSKHPISGREAPLQLCYPPPTGAATTMPLPDAYEMDSAAKLYRVTCNLQDTNFSVSYVAANTAVNLVLYAIWEPNVEISDAERDFLYSQCAISAQQPKLINNTAT